MKNLGQLFDEYGSDKNSIQHIYTPYYEKHLPEKVDNFLEIGIFRGGGIRAFKEYYNNEGNFHGINYKFGGEHAATQQQFNDWGIQTYQGDQNDETFLRQFKPKFNVIVDDGSHHSDSQLLTFKHFFVNNLEDGGLYVCEDVCGHLPEKEGEYWRRGKVNTAEDTIMGIARKWLHEGSIESQFFTKKENDVVSDMISEINIYDDKIIFFNKK